MLRIKSIASSSLGNCYTVDDGQTKLLIECGIPAKRIRQGLDFALSSISGCLCSHSHQDHCKAAKDIMRAGIDLFTSQGTIDALSLTGHRVKPIEAGKQFKIGTFTVLPFDVEHDVAYPLGFLVASGKDKLCFATDTAFLRHRFKGVTVFMLECNYQKEILETNIANESISITQKNRLLFSHFELSNLLEFLKDNDLSKLKAIHLLHLSASNSNANEMRRAVMELTQKPVKICKE